MSDTTTVEPPVETYPLLRRATDPKPLPPRMPRDSARNGFSFVQVAALVGIAVFVNGIFLLIIALRNSVPAPVTAVPVAMAPVVSAPIVVAPAPVQPVAVAPATPAPVIPAPAPPKPFVVRPAPTAPVAVTPHVVKHRAVADTAAKPIVARAPVVLTPPNIDTVDYNGPIVHLEWKSLGNNVTYKVYSAPNALKPSFDFRYNKYGPTMDWFLNENKSWRYVAITVVDKNGKESALSNIVDTTPGQPKPEF